LEQSELPLNWHAAPGVRLVGRVAHQSDAGVPAALAPWDQKKDSHRVRAGAQTRQGLHTLHTNLTRRNNTAKHQIAASCGKKTWGLCVRTPGALPSARVVGGKDFVARSSPCQVTSSAGSVPRTIPRRVRSAKASRSCAFTIRDALPRALLARTWRSDFSART